MASSITFPELLRSAEAASAEQQSAFFKLTALQLSLLAGAAVAALAPAGWAWRAGPIITAVLFLAALVLQVSAVAPRAERRWYDARAAAESIKSASWEFSVRGEAFRSDDDQAERRFVGVLKKVLEALSRLDIGAASAVNASVTSSMRELRASDRASRASTYISERVEDQVRWYQSKAAWNKRRSHVFTYVAVVIEAAAVIVGIIRAASGIDLDLLGALAAVAVAVIGWMQAKKYASLSEAYAVTSHEVALVASTLSGEMDEDAWAQAVHDAEAAFSREHTMWQARRQAPV